MSSTQRSKFTRVKEQMDAVKQLEDTDKTSTDDDDDEQIAPVNDLLLSIFLNIL